MHSTIKLHLDPEEFAPVARLAQELRVTPEAIAYAGLNRIMRSDVVPGNWTGRIVNPQSEERSPCRRKEDSIARS
jgi:hypothetical protein